MSQVTEPITGPVLDGPIEPAVVDAPRLARHQIILEDGHEVGIAVAGRGVPLVVVHGFTAEGFLYAQTLSRLVNMGFKVIAIDTAGHGGTQGLPTSAHNLNTYAELLGRVVDELGITRYILAGHSMGGQLICRLAAQRPEQVIAVMCIDAIVGDTWDRLVYLFRVAPGLLALMGAGLVLDSALVAPLFRDPRQAMKLLRLVAPTIAGHMVRPWRMLGPAISILRTRSSRYALDAMAEAKVTTIAIHGDRDFPVPLQTARDTVRRTDGVLVTVKGGNHSWLLRDPETLPAIVAELLDRELGEAIRRVMRAAGVRRKNPTLEDVEAVCFVEGARIHGLTPTVTRRTMVGRHRKPRYRWATEHLHAS